MVAAKTASDDAAKSPDVEDSGSETKSKAETKAEKAEADEPTVEPPILGNAPPTGGRGVAVPEKSKPVVLATSLTQALSLPDLDGGKGVVLTSGGVALSKSDAAKAHEAAESCGIVLIDKTPAEPEKGDG